MLWRLKFFFHRNIFVLKCHIRQLRTDMKIKNENKVENKLEKEKKNIMNRVLQ